GIPANLRATDAAPLGLVCRRLCGGCATFVSCRLYPGGAVHLVNRDSSATSTTDYPLFHPGGAVFSGTAQEVQPL
ncbi:MAG TPA: hypothetical protein VJ417_16770, partial [Candidatus Glassbacteria bacterium]|nr:hypothetical protein [Candidatus Glassbacteria bacterium]